MCCVSHLGWIAISYRAVKFKLRLFPMKRHTVLCPQTKSKHETLVQKGVDVAVRSDELVAKFCE